MITRRSLAALAAATATAALLSAVAIAQTPAPAVSGAPAATGAPPAAATAPPAATAPQGGLSNSKFTPAALTEAQKAGKSILVEISAPWCPVCKAQKVVLGTLAKDAKYKDFVKLEIDFDSQKTDVRSLKGTRQSTLIVFKGDKEVARGIGDTSKEAIEGLLAKAL